MAKFSIGLSYHKGSAVSSIIKAVEGSNFSHIYIRKVSRYGEYVYQASGLQVNFMNIDIFLKENIIVEEYEFEISEEKKDLLIAFFMKYCGTSYGIKALFQILLLILCKRLNIPFQLKGDGTKTFVCSELGALLCKEILEIEIEGDIDFITPKYLRPIIMKYGKRII